MPVTQRCAAHVSQPDAALAAAIGQHVTLAGVEFGRCDHLMEEENSD